MSEESKALLARMTCVGRALQLYGYVNQSSWHSSIGLGFVLASAEDRQNPESGSGWVDWARNYARQHPERRDPLVVMFRDENDG